MAETKVFMSQNGHKYMVQRGQKIMRPSEVEYAVWDDNGEDDFMQILDTNNNEVYFDTEKQAVDFLAKNFGPIEEISRTISRRPRRF